MEALEPGASGRNLFKKPGFTLQCIPSTTETSECRDGHGWHRESSGWSGLWKGEGESWGQLGSSKVVVAVSEAALLEPDPGSFQGACIFVRGLVECTCLLQ